MNGDLHGRREGRARARRSDGGAVRASGAGADTRAVRAALTSALLACLSGGASAHESDAYAPRYFDVVELADDDRLNVRAAPSVDAEDIGDLASGSGPIEITGTDASGRWGRLPWEGMDGWVAMRYLTSVTPAMLAGASVPIGLRCVGTEPFWRVELLSAERMRLERLGEETPAEAALVAVSPSVNYASSPIALSATTKEGDIVAVLHARRCGDGMSDRTFAWSVDVLIGGADAPVLMSGCCYLPRAEP